MNKRFRVTKSIEFRVDSDVLFTTTEGDILEFRVDGFYDINGQKVYNLSLLFADVLEEIKEESIYQVGDKVYSATKGWGIIIETRTCVTKYPIVVAFSGSSTIIYTQKGKRFIHEICPELSFTEYDYVDGGFSQDRKDIVPVVKDGQLVYVKEFTSNMWDMRFATGKFDGRFIETYKNNNKSGPTLTWTYYSLTNPLEEN